MLQDDLWEQILGNLSPHLAVLVHGVQAELAHVWLFQVLLIPVKS